MFIILLLPYSFYLMKSNNTIFNILKPCPAPCYKNNVYLKFLTILKILMNEESSEQHHNSEIYNSK